jgi:predicted kinase
MFKQAEILAKNGKGVILDATFVTQKLRRRAAKVASLMISLTVKFPSEQVFE